MGVCAAEILDFEERDGAGGEAEVRVVRSENLHTVGIRKRQLRRRGLFELDSQPHDVAEKADHRLVLARRNAEPAEAQDSQVLGAALVGDCVQAFAQIVDVARDVVQAREL